MGTVTPLPVTPGPYAAVRAVRAHSTATGPARGVLTVIATYADDHGVAWPSLDTIARDSGYSRSTVHRAIESLAAAGELIVTRGGGRGKSSRYRIPLSPQDSEVVENNPQAEDNPPLKGVTLTLFPQRKGVRDAAKGCQGDTRTTKELPRGEEVTFRDHCPAHALVENPPPCRGCGETRKANAAADSVAAKLEADRARAERIAADRAAVEAAKAATAPPRPDYLEARRAARDNTRPGRVHSTGTRKDPHP